MPVIIDTNCFSSVFSRKDVSHKEFEPVLNWITKGNGKIVYGGTQYKTELRRAKKFLPIFRYFKEIGKVIIGDNENIDRIQVVIKNKIDDDRFDDKHLSAIIIDTKCRIICSKDTRSIPYIKNPILYPRGIKVPVFYTSKRNIDLLSDSYIDDKYKPVSKLKKVDSSILIKQLENADKNTKHNKKYT